MSYPGFSCVEVLTDPNRTRNDPCNKRSEGFVSDLIFLPSSAKLSPSRFGSRVSAVASSTMTHLSCNGEHSRSPWFRYSPFKQPDDLISTSMTGGPG